jgi:quinohemoprotein ethanol dehydrogenase
LSIGYYTLSQVQVKGSAVKKYFLIPLVLTFYSTCSHGAVDSDRLLRPDKEPQNWLSHGRNYAEDRESPLTQITPDNVEQLGLAWSFATGTKRGLEASPLVIDGVIYSTGSWSHVYANDAVTGELLWQYDPKVDRNLGASACCDVVNRGVAAWGDDIFVGALDGRLIALDSQSGEMRWEVLTVDSSRQYTITGAPRVVDGKVIIGNGGAEYGVRGYVSAYDALNGDLIWRFYTVPGDPALPAEADILREAEKTWTGDLYWKVGGGGTVWDSMAYDPALNLLYFGVGNGSPWNRYVRSPGGGDNLFLSSIVAVNADTGAYVWHYQTTPGDSWDYTATQHIILADIDIAGEIRKVLMQAPKNGFFYVIDRTDGQLISAENYTRVTWASHVDMTTGRPVETDVADHSLSAKNTTPASFGGHNWHPMAFNRATGLVYIPASENQEVYSTTEKFVYRTGAFWNLGQSETTTDGGRAMASPLLTEAFMSKLFKSTLIAWDPVTQVERWHVDQETAISGGLLTTSTELLFQGTGDGYLKAYHARTGALLWQAATGKGIIAPSVSYAVDGVQYIAVLAGMGGVSGLVNMPGVVVGGQGQLLVFKLGGGARMPVDPPPDRSSQPARQGSEDSRLRGGALYLEHCIYCHGIPTGQRSVIADLPFMDPTVHKIFADIVTGGAFASKGMKDFSEDLTIADVDAIHDYLIDRANAILETQAQPGWWLTIKRWFFSLFASLVLWANS